MQKSGAILSEKPRPLLRRLPSARIGPPFENPYFENPNRS